MEKELIAFEYGAMSSKYSIQASNKLTAYCAIIAHYDKSNHLVLIYSPEEYKVDNWASFDGKIAERLDEVFGGEGNFDKYFEENIEDIKTAYSTIKQLV